MNKSPKFVFFGGEPLGVPTLKTLVENNLKPSLVVCNPDRRSGRGHKLTPPPLKELAESYNIPVFQPDTYKDNKAKDFLTSETWDLFVVVAYNFILPKWLLNTPQHGTLNVHPSLLPKLRGASPIRTAILENQPENVGVSIILLDEEMDHGPILAQEPYQTETWPVPGPELDATLANLGGKLLVKTIPQWLVGEISPQPQDHERATYCHKLNKDLAKLELDPFNLPGGFAAQQTISKIYAFAGLGDTYFLHNAKRVKIKSANIDNDKLQILRVVPEGKKEIDFTDYLNSFS